MMTIPSILERIRAGLGSVKDFVLSFLERTLVFFHQLDSLFGWFEDGTTRSEQYRRRVGWLDTDISSESEPTVVYDTVVRNRKALGRRGYLTIIVPPRTSFVQGAIPCNECGIPKEEERTTDRSEKPTCEAVATQRQSAIAPRLVKKPKGKGKLGLLEVIVPPNTALLDEGRRELEYYKQKRIADKVLREAAQLELPSASLSELESFLPSQDCDYMDYQAEHKFPSMSGPQSDGSDSKSDTYVPDSVDSGLVEQGDQNLDVWLDIYSQETRQRKVSKTEASSLYPNSSESKINRRDFATSSAHKVRDWIKSLTPVQSTFWDEM